MKLCYEVLPYLLKSAGIINWNLRYNSDPNYEDVRFNEKGDLIAEISDHDNYTHKGDYIFSKKEILDSLDNIIEEEKTAEKIKNRYLKENQ